MEFAEIVGKKFNFHGVCFNEFKLDDIVWEAVEDPDDGYRSYMDSVVKVKSTGVFFEHSLAQIVVEEAESLDNDSDCAGYRFKDILDGHIWLEFGTANQSDYYPWFVFKYFPKGEMKMPLFLTPYFEKQRELDDIPTKRFELDKKHENLHEWLYERRVMALQVELMECCNAWRGFKYWSEDQEPKEDLLEEYVDGFHFVLSIGNLLDMDKVVVANFPSSPAVGEPLTMFALVADVAAQMHKQNAYNFLLMTFLDLGYSLDFTWEQITNAYNDKYEVNIRRWTKENY